MEMVQVSVSVPKVAEDLAQVLADLVVAIKSKESISLIIGSEFPKVVALIGEIGDLPGAVKDHSVAVVAGLLAQKVEDALSPVPAA